MAFLQRFFGPRGDGKIDKLREMPELASLGDAELTQVAAAGELALIPQGTVLLQEGQGAHWCYLVLAGSVVPRDDRDSASQSVTTAVGDGQTLTHDASPPTVVAETDLVVLAMGSRQFAGLLNTCPGFSRAVYVSLAHRAHAQPDSRPPRQPVLQLLGGT